ncbi:MAG: ATP-grasp domain-containing protein [Alicyclobacillus herbarius]|uniref:ATP-grasp domain-containing protein n=1 Tax=Alicyclobacillus herbarius TaxID=122960 RepID=UPI000405056D|nr:ATP-grasp domain-containing protein [Alicyclobacillus herbarius]MCL6632668.1 ATP-grasp domain-containing protein [Alicyclobacillus herbarius]
MKTLIFIGCNKHGSSRDAIAAAKQLGLHTVLLTDRPSFLRNRESFSYVDDMVWANLQDTEHVEHEIRERMQRRDVCAIISFTDAHVLTAARLAQKFNLPHQTVNAIARMQDKLTLRECLRESPYSIPFQRVSADSKRIELWLELPVVVKSPRSTGSKDVFFASSSAEFEHYATRLRNRYPGYDLLVESYVSGPQFLAEVLVHEGQARVVAIVEQVITFGERFIVTGYCIRPYVDSELRQAVEDMVADIRERTGMETGAFHVEFRWSHHKCRIIEVNPRISGAAMNRLIEYTTGINLAKETIRSLCGEEPDLTPQSRYVGYARYLTVDEPGYLEKVTGRHRARKIRGIREVFVQPHKNAYLMPPLSMGKRYAYVIAVAKDEEEAKSAAEKAASCIRFHLRSTQSELKNRESKRGKYKVRGKAKG